MSAIKNTYVHNYKRAEYNTVHWKQAEALLKKQNVNLTLISNAEAYKDFYKFNFVSRADAVQKRIVIALRNWL